MYFLTDSSIGYITDIPPTFAPYFSVKEGGIVSCIGIQGAYAPSQASGCSIAVCLFHSTLSK